MHTIGPIQICHGSVRQFWVERVLNTEERPFVVNAMKPGGNGLVQVGPVLGRFHTHADAVEFASEQARIDKVRALIASKEPL